MIHKALLGSLERFISIYIEHTAGNFPLWLSPVQVSIIPVGEATTTDARDESSQEVHPYIAPQDSTEADRINTWLVQLDSIQNAEDPVIYFEVIEVKKGNTLDKFPFLLSPYEAALFADREDLPKSYDSTGMLNVMLTIDDQYVKATRKSGKYFFYRNTPDKYCLAEN
jgi:hypothetical protein